MFKKSFIGLASTLLVGMLAMGCSDDDDGGFVVIGFPGTASMSDVSVHFLSADEIAFTEDGLSVLSGGIKCFSNCSSTAQIAFLHMGRDINDDGTVDQTYLYVTYFNGSTWSPPVELRGVNQSLANGVVFGSAMALFIDSTGRSGDALIAYRAADLDDLSTTTVVDGGQIRAFYSYFTLTGLGTAVSTTNPNVRYGFDTRPTAADVFDVTIDNVTGLAFVSDSLCGSSDFDATTQDYESGQATTFASLLYHQNIGTTGSRWFRANFDLDTTSNSTNVLAAGTSAVTITPAITTGINVGTAVKVHNGLALWSYSQAATVVTGTVQYLQAIDYSLATAAGTLINRLTDNATLNTNIAVSEIGDIFGADDGLDDNYLGLIISGEDNDGTIDNADADVLLVHITLGTAAPTVDRVEADNNGAADNTANAGTVVAANTLTGCINRDNTVITYTWLQTADEDLATANNNTVALFARIVQPDPAGASTASTPFDETLTNSIAPDLTTTNEATALLLSTTVGGTGTTGDDSDVNSYEAQEDYGCFASNPLILSFLYIQEVDESVVSAAGGQEFRLAAASTITVLRTTAATPPTVTSVNVVITAASDATYPNCWSTGAGNLAAAAAADGGSDGGLVVYYIQNGNNLTDDTVAGASNEARVHASTAIMSSTAGATAIPSGGTLAAQEIGSFDTMTTGTFNGDNNIASGNLDLVATGSNGSATVHNVFFGEINGVGGEVRWMWRQFQNGGTLAAGGTALDLLFPTVSATAALNEAPASVFANATGNGPRGFQVFRNGAALAALGAINNSFSATGIEWRIYQSELSGTTWTGPEPVDHDTAFGPDTAMSRGGVYGVDPWFICLNEDTSCNDRVGTSVFWTKTESRDGPGGGAGTIGGDVRAQVRVQQ